MSNTARNAKIQYESAQELVSYAALTDSGDHIIYTNSTDIWSERSGYEPSVRPNGIVSGTNLVSATTNNNEVAVAAFTAYFAGSLVSVSADTSVTLTRDAALDYQKFSVVCTSGGALTIIESDPHAAAFSTTRGAAGGPPSIPLASIEIAQIWLTNKSDAVIASTEIKQSVEAGQQERYDYPVFDTNPIGDGNQASDADKINAYVEFAAALPVSHGATANGAATATKPVYAQVYSPIFVTIKESVDFVPAEVSTSATSTQLYRITTASTSDSLGSASCTVHVDDGVSDSLVKLDGEKLTFKFYPDENKAPYSVTQGVFRKTTSFPVDSAIALSCTIAAEQKTVNFDS